MDKLFRHPEIAYPPGSLRQIVSHPVEHSSRAIEVAIFNDHRYAFFYWNSWLNSLKKKDSNASVPALVSLDWHQDLCYPDESEKKSLKKLNLKSKAQTSFFSWARMVPLNDSHILSAAYLNLVSNIYVHCRQGNFAEDWEDESFTDLFGNTHSIKKFKEFNDLENHLLSSKETDIFFDIDLDFFALKNGKSDGKFKFTYLPDETIKNYLSPERPLIKWIFERMAGFTIAMEPEHTGGFLKSCRYLSLIDHLYFKPGLFSHRCNWRHVSKARKQAKT